MTLRKEDLRQFTGTESFYRYPLGDFVFTDGVHHVADKGGAFWLVDKIFALQHHEGVAGEGFQFWTLKVAADATAVLSCEDGNGRQVYAESLYYTDFPLDEVCFYFTDNTLLLPSEY